MARRTSTSSVSTLQIVVGVLLLLAVGVGLAISLAPEKPPAPPTSAISFNDRPEEKKADDRARRDSWQPRFRPGDAASTREASVSEAAPNSEEQKSDKPFLIRGAVVDARGGEPVPFTRISAKRLWTQGEKDSWSIRNQEAMRAQDDATLSALAEEERRLTATATARTNEAGVFELPLEQAGDYELVAFSPHFLRQTQTSGPVDEEQPTTEVRIELSTGAIVTGRVTEAGTGQGAAEVPVQLESDPEHRTFTDEDGNYELGGLEPGDYGLLVVTRNTPYMNTSEVPYKRVRVNDPAEEVRNVNFTVEAAGVIWGYVMTPDKAPITGAEVITSSGESVLSQAFAAMVTQAPPVTDRSEEDGYYELLGVPLNREWRVYATADSFTPQLANPVILSGSNRNVRVDIFMFDGTSIMGAVVDPDGKPIPEANVVCIPSYSKLLSPLDSAQAFRRAQADSEGAYLIEQVPQGNYQLIARKDGFKFSAVGEPVYPDGMTDIKNFNLVLYPANEGSHTVYGTVTDGGGNPIGGATCRLEGMGSESMSSFEQVATTGGNGRFEITGVEVGMYRLRVSAEGYAPRSIPRVLLDEETPVVLQTAALVRGVVLVKESNSPPDETELPYLVRAIQTGEVGEAGDAMLVSFNMARAEQSFQRPDGTFEINVPPGYYTLEAEAPGLTKGRVELLAAGGEVIEDVVIYVSEAGGAIEGKVSSVGGGGVEGAEVRLVDLSTGGGMVPGADGGERIMRVGPDGFFSFTLLPAGVYNVIASHPNYANGTHGPVQLGEGQSYTNADIRLGSGGVLVGRVTRNNKPVSGALVLVVGVENATSRTVNTDEDGNYMLDGLASGQYEVTVTPLNSGNIGDIFDRMGGSVEVIEGQEVRLDFGGTGGVRVAGSCFPGPPGLGGEIFFRTPGSPVIAPPGQQLRPEDLGRISAIHRTAIQPGTGSFLIENVQPGTYQVEVYYFVNIFAGDIRNVFAGNVDVPATDQINVPIAVDLAF